MQDKHTAATPLVSSNFDQVIGNMLKQAWRRRHFAILCVLSELVEKWQRRAGGRQ